VKSIQQLLAELLDREAVRELPRLYCHYLWTRDPDHVAGHFTEDATTCIQGMEDYAITGRDKARRGFQKDERKVESLTALNLDRGSLSHGQKKAAGISVPMTELAASWDRLSAVPAVGRASLPAI